MCRNHRGFVDAIVATAKLGADILLLNTAFAGPQLVDVLEREEPAGRRSTTRSSPGCSRRPTSTTRVLGLGRRRRPATPTSLESLIAAYDDADLDAARAATPAS